MNVLTMRQVYYVINRVGFGKFFQILILQMANGKHECPHTNCHGAIIFYICQ